MSTPDFIDRFLRQEVESASPAKLHLLLLQRAHGLSVHIADLWRKNEVDASIQWIILVRDILAELIAGIVDPKHPLAKQQSDLYIFLSALLATAEQDKNIAAIDDLREILEIEMTSWEMLVKREGMSQVPPIVVNSLDSATSFDFSA